MPRNELPLPFLFIVTCAAVFVGVSGTNLPQVVASHFDTSGAANGFMPRQAYVVVMLALIVVLPASMVFGSWRAIGKPDARLNLPNRDYFLAPERRDETIAFIRTRLLWFGSMLLAFLCYAHWLVVRANALRPAQLSAPWLVAGLTIFLLATLVWLLSMLRHFKRPA